MIKRIVFLIAVVLSTGAASAQEAKITPEQQQMTPQPQQEMSQQQMQVVIPFFSRMITEMMTAQFQVLATLETADKLAAFTKNYYEALVKKGFPKKEALEIVKAVGFPPMPGMQIK